MSRRGKLTLGSLLAIAALAFAGLSFMAGSPRDVYGLVRYALPHMHRGKLRVGEDAPDVRLLALDGSLGRRLLGELHSRGVVPGLPRRGGVNPL